MSNKNETNSNIIIDKKSIISILKNKFYCHQATFYEKISIFKIF